MRRGMRTASIAAVLSVCCPLGQAAAQEFEPNLSPEEQKALMGDEVPMEVILRAAEHGKAIRDSQAVKKVRGKKNGNLSGKRISLSPGHGIEPENPWEFQRGVAQNLREDKHTYEWVSEFLKPMLERAGAETLMMRAYSFTESTVIVSNTDSNYTETGEWAKGSAGDYRYAYVSANETATASWSFKVAKDGYYPVYVKYYTSDNRVKDAQFTIKHARGESVVTQNQNFRGIKSGAKNGSDVSQNSETESTNTWHYLGTYPFSASENGAVTLSNVSSEDSKKVVIADSVQVGDGAGVYKNSAGKTSGYFKWQESAQTWFKYLGLPDWVTYSDVKGRNLYSLYEGVDAQLSLHSNAATGTARGTQTYVWYHANSAGNLQWVQEDNWGSDFINTHLPPGTYEYATHIHQRFLEYTKQYISSDWKSYGKLWSACFGELSPSRNAWYYNKNNNPIIVPSALIETAFHDNSTDAGYIADQAFRFYGARAIMAGMIQYFKGDDAVIPPLPPNKLTVTAESDHLNLSWSAVEDKVLSNSKPTSYNIYTSDDGVLFDVDPLMNVSETSAELPISYGQTLYVRVTAVNSGGESLDSIVGVGRLPKTGQKKVLYVDGVDRETKNYYDANINRSYARIYAPAILFNYPGAGIEFADDEAAAELLKSHSYDAVIWAAGSTSTDTDVLPPEQRDAVKELRTKGTPLVLTGGDIAYALVDSKYNSDTSWLENNFNAGYIDDNAYNSTHADQSFTGSDIISGTVVYSGCIADGGKVSNPSSDAACVHYPDALKASGGTALLKYSGCSKSSCDAAILSSDGKAVLVGFPLESIVDSNQRLCTIANLIAKVRGDSINGDCSPVVWNPPAEVCGNGIDDNEDGKTDCEDSACSGLDECKAPEPEITEEICGNGKDDDGNGKTDCDDPACSTLAECQSSEPEKTEEICGNGKDDDGNGQTDCDDPACSALAECQSSEPDETEEICGNGKDDDGNGKTDCDDPACSRNKKCQDDEGDDEKVDKDDKKTAGGTQTTINGDSDCSMHSGSPTGSAPLFILGLLGLVSIRRRKSHNNTV